MMLIGRPAPLTDCKIANDKYDEKSKIGFRVHCLEGFDGGLPQSFVLEIYAHDQLKSKVTNSRPDFEVSHLDMSFEPNSAAQVKLYIFSQNAKGTSEPFIMEKELIQNKRGNKKHFVEGCSRHNILDHVYIIIYFI